MGIEKFSISNDPKWYEAWPDVVRTESGKLICVFSECTHHRDRSYTRIMLTESTDRGRTWSAKHPLTDAGTAEKKFYYNCARIVRLSDGVLAVSVDRIRFGGREDNQDLAEVLLYFSFDEGKSWSEAVQTPLKGIVPDKLTELPDGRWLLSAHTRSSTGRLAQFLHYSDDRGRTWSERITVASEPEFDLCEVSLLPMGNGTVAAFLRENSGRGWDCKKTLSHDNGKTWGPVIDFPIPGCHRPTAGFLKDGEILITCRFLQGGLRRNGLPTQNLFACLTDREGVLAGSRAESAVRILPVDYDRSPFADTGYSGWVNFPDGEIYIVNYIVDDAWNKAQIRGYSLRMEDFLLTQEALS